MKISRQVGTIEELVPIFVQDATVSTGAGLPNLLISSFSSYYHRSDMTSTSSVTLVSTGTLGTWSSGQWLQINSTFMRGWYQFALPNGMWAAGSTCAVHMYGHASMSPVVFELEIIRFNNQRYVSSQPHNLTRLYSDALVTTAAGIVAAGPVGVSSVTDKAGYGVSSISDKAGYSVSSISVGVSTSWFSGGTVVTSAAGVLSVNVSSIQRDSAVTTAAGVLAVGAVGVSSFGIRVGVSSFNSPVGVSSFGVAVGVSSMNAPVDVSSFYGSGAITSAAGVLASHVTTIRTVVSEAVADALLLRNVSSGVNTGRTVREALYLLRNLSDRVAGTLTVYQTDDTTSSWSATVSTVGGNPIVRIDPD